MANIAIVEDDISLATIYKKSLEEAGYSAAILADSIAVAKIKIDKPDLVLLDILMPNVNGIDILRELKSDSSVSHIPVILLTNVADSKTISKGLEFGAYGYLLKSEIAPSQIIQRVKMALDEIGVKING